jgi:hypothetical protein
LRRFDRTSSRLIESACRGDVSCMMSQHTDSRLYRAVFYLHKTREKRNAKGRSLSTPYEYSTAALCVTTVNYNC